MPALPLVVVETESGAEVRLRDADAGEAYPTLRAALDSLLANNDYRPKRGILRDETGREVGQWRWLDATAEESAPAPDGSQVTRDLIATMAARLNAGSPAPMDGGTSPAHSQLSATETRSDGYVHTGVEVQDRAGRWHLFVYAETSPDVARDIDSGRLAYGSIGFSSDGRLLQHALTNVPAVEGLAPNNSVRATAGVHFRSMRITMPKISKRATLAEAEPMLLEMLGVSAEELGTKLVELAAAAKAAAEKPEAEMESAPVESAEAREQTASEEPVKRAVPGLEDHAALEAFAASVVGGMQDLFGKPEASPSELLDLFTASLAAFKGALGQGAPPDDAGADAAAMSQQDATAARAALTALPALRAEVASLRAEVVKRDALEAIQRLAVEAKATLSSEQLEQLVADTLAVQDTAIRGRMIVNALRSSIVPTGDVFARAHRSQATAHESLAKAAEALIPEVERAHPGEARHFIVARAQRLAAERFPGIGA
ncbi:MAG: hypothetical protein IPK80_02675 [Nannocystis sp.]|nr:hypothetical protein [Nannocystis sp.]